MLATRPPPAEAHEVRGLRFREAMYRALAEKAPIPVVLSDVRNGEIVFTNQVANDVFNHGQSPVGAATLDFYENPEDREVLFATLRAEGGLREYPLRLRRSDGSVGEFLVYMLPSPIDDRVLVYSYLLDVTRQRVAEHSLERRNDDMERILANVGEGLLMIDRDGVIQGERSAAVDRWLRAPRAGEKLWELTGDRDSSFGQWLELGWEAVVDGVLPLELCLEQLPRLLRLEDRFIEVAVTPITDAAGEIEQALVVLSDKTEAVARERAEREQRELLSLFDRLLRDRAGVVEMAEETERMLQQLDTGPAPGDAIRLLHTLKGNFGLFGLGALAEICHELESSATESGVAPTREARAPLTMAWERVEERLGVFLDARDDDHVELERADYEALLEAIRERKDHRALLRMVEDWELEPASRRLGRVARQAKALARRLGRGDIEVEIDAGGVRLDPARWKRFWSAFAHAVRNAVDHGLETVDERVAAGKPTPGRLSLTLRRDPSGVCLTLADDGRGIDWAALDRKAVAKGLASGSRDARLEALFADGVSTRVEVSSVSGRGVGMGALREATRALGGEIDVESAPGAGTRLTFRFPNQKASSNRV